MKAKPVRIILAFYSAKDEPQKAFETVQSVARGHSSLFRQDGSVAGPVRKLERYRALPLEGESLVAAELPAPDVQAVVKLLLSEGSPTIFVVSEDPSGALCREQRAKEAPVLARLRENQRILESVRDGLLEASRLDHALPAAAEWILDNVYLIRTQINEVRNHLPRSYPRSLPVNEAGEPRLHYLAEELAKIRDYALDQAVILDYLREYQREQAALTVAELWLFPLLLRVALIEGLAVLAQGVSQAQQLREAAYLWANRLAASARTDPAAFGRMLRLMEAEPCAMEPYFVASLSEQLQDEEGALAPVQHWIEERLHTTVSDLVRREHVREAAARQSTANAFGSLRMLSRIDFAEVFEDASVVEGELRADPGGIYPRSSFSTRDRCRRAVESIARWSGMSEPEVARRAVLLASGARGDPRRGHVGFYLLAAGIPELEEQVHAHLPFRVRFTRAIRRNATPVYLAGIAGLTLSLLALSLGLAWEGGVHQPVLLMVLGTLALFPLSEWSGQMINVLVISLLPPETLPKLDFEDGIPEEDATLVVVPMMLRNADVVRSELEKLEVRFLANPDPRLFFGLFSDFTDAQQQTTPQDAGLFEEARLGIEKLNQRYAGGHFLLFHRQRAWSRSEQCWIGRERKRGKIEDLNAYLLGEGSPDILAAGKLPLPVRYVITLDADSQLPPDTARRLVETIAHPLNRAEIDEATRVCRGGYAIIQPRVSIALPGAMATRFTRIFADSSGTDPYCQSVSDAHQDLFGEATFHGKAIYDVRAFRTAVGDRFPAETILSHDLIEGAHAGVALATDIELFENLPLDYASYSKREHRWIRGDWAIAPWIFSRVPTPGGGRVPNPLSLINRWRIFDNLRRSLVPMVSVLLLLFGWLSSPAPGVWSLVVGLAVIVPALAPLLDRMARRIQGTVQRWQGAETELLRAIVMIAFLPYQAWISADAITRVLYRRFVSCRHLLEWQTAEDAGSPVHRHTISVYQKMWVVSGLSAVVLFLQQRKGGLASTAVFLALWIVAPELMRWLARPAPRYAREKLDRTDARFLRVIARRSWRYFDDLVGEKSNWLPPDNSQLALHVEIAQRTSPTNIGLSLTSALAATDLGYQTMDQFLERCEHTMSTLDRLERYEGHLLNWYDTRTLEPLAPRYVSSVDSGNLLASLWVLKHGCNELLERPIIGPACAHGLNDTLSILYEVCGPEPSMAGPIHALRRLLRGKPEGHHLVARLRLTVTALDLLRSAGRWHEPGDEPSYWISRMAAELDAWTAAVCQYLQWMETLSQPPDEFLKTLGAGAAKLRRRAGHVVPSLLDLSQGGASTSAVEAILSRRSVPGLSPEVRAWLDQVGQEYEQARTHAAAGVRRLRDLAALAERWAAGINMRFLYDRERRLLGVGYPIGGPLQFTSHYDLLASESRLASFVAIAKGDVPKEHWFALARPRVAAPHGRQTLLSWSGTMFEYLMPLLFMRSYDNSLLDHACREAIREQIEYGEESGVPWGASESAYSGLDANQTYQYRAFGVPSLALRPPREEDLVIAPYATMLALPLDPVAAIANLRKLETFQLGGPMGFYESIDFGLENTLEGERGVPVYAYMAHHQGMTLMALDEILNRDVMRRRFHAEVRVRAMEPLLFEKIPITSPPAEEALAPVAAVRLGVKEESSERSWQEDTLIPRIHLQGNGRYSILLTNSGGGYSRWDETDVTRWRCDPTLDRWGNYLYIRDLRSNAVWAASHDPIPGDMETSSVRFSADRAEFQRRASGVDTVLAVTVATEDDVELRRLTITNRSLRSRELEITSYAELVLAPHRADSAHPAFAKMFVETECLPGMIIAHRRPRSPEDLPVWAAEALVGAGEEIQHETDRARFLGRGGTLANPAALRTALSGSDGAVLDPIFSSRCRVTLQARERREITFLIIAASSREEVLNLAAKYQHPEAVARAFEMAWTRAQLEFRYLGISPAAAHRFQELAGHLVFPNPRMRAAQDRTLQAGSGQAALWAHGISGDLPILSVAASDARHLPLVRELLLAHTYWRLRGLRVDLVILNQESPSYDRPFEQQLRRQIDAHSVETGVDKPGGVFLRDWHAIPEQHRHLLLAASYVVLSGARGPLQQQLVSSEERPGQLALFPSGVAEETTAPLPFLELPYFNGLGGFTPDGHEYAIYLKPGGYAPAPWSNIVANPAFGTLVTESGLGFTWCGNSQSNRLTPWSNDPVSDPQSEIIYLRDDETGQAWTTAPLPIREKEAYRARHGQGYTVFEHNSHSIEQELTVFVPLDEDRGQNGSAPVKICHLRLRNASARARRLTLFYFAEWVLGSVREEQLPHVRTSRDEMTGALIATQSWSGAHSGEFAFAAASPDAASYSCDRAQFLGREGSLEKPDALRRASLDNRASPVMDPAAVLQVPVTIAPGQSQEVIFLLGQAKTMADVRGLVSHYKDRGNVAASLEATRRWWDSRLDAIHVKTPVLSVDFLLNRWLPYQALACRYWGRSGFYQSSGAFGFRDQLQDVMAIVYFAPELAREHILACAARQFIEGDVQHWWHPETGLGVRTRCSDDLVWLPYAVAHYVTVTGDTGILDIPATFLEGPELKDEEQEQMFVPTASAQTAPLWEHCQRAMDRAWRLGPHELPLFGSGDWNDGMNLVGRGGKGESVWLAWFLCHVVESFGSVMERRETGQELARAWRERAASLAAAIERHCWDGEWYLRGFFDNGGPLGSHLNPEAKIDSLAQSWAVISGVGAPDRARRAMEAADRMLADDRHRLVLLFTPPFDHSQPHPGYIMGYPPGMRENGGQYTHGSLWMAAAWARLGEPEAAVRLLTMMNPVEHGRDPEMVARYRGEPYVAAGDVYSAAGRMGQCGWTWYSGSAAWMYRIWLEDVLGFRLRGDTLTLAPTIPAQWDGFEIRYRFRSATYAIAVRRRASDQLALEVDGQPAEPATIKLADDGGTHSVTLWIPQRAAGTVGRSGNWGAQPPAPAPKDTSEPMRSLLPR